MPLYPYQYRVKELIKSGKSVILQAPTGSGKTRAALSPFIENFFDRPVEDAPHKCIYCVPMRVLANHFVAEYQALAASYNRKFHREIRVTIQTGDHSDDKEFTGDIIFCTIDQFLSSILTMPYGLPNRRANLNAGIGVGSYLVFDEFHLLDPDSTLPTAWQFIKLYSQVAPILLMTATFSYSMLNSLAKDLKAEVVTVSEEEALQIERRNPTPQPRQRSWWMENKPLSAQAILAEHHHRSLVLCNTVQRAQNVYRSLKELISQNDLPIRLMILHSRFLPEDRERIEQDLKKLFGIGENCDSTGSVIVVATQTIEVGVDISSEVLHTELAPSSSLIQRAGRCARYPGEQGKVIVYPVENYAPYALDSDGNSWKKEMLDVSEWLTEHSGEVLDFTKEQEMVNAVATPRDIKVVDGLMAGRASRKQDIMRVLNGNWQAGDNRLLIRDASSCRILIHSQPDELLEDPYNATGFNIQPSTLFGFFKEWQERANQLELDWIAKVLVEPKNDSQESNISEYRWERLGQSLIPTARLIVVNPELTGYDPIEGFCPDQGKMGFESGQREKRPFQAMEMYHYQLEAYEDHITKVLKAFETVVLPELIYPARALEHAAGWRQGILVEAAWLTCLFHDVGKLTTGWQKWAHSHQVAVGKPVSNAFAIAHTDTRIDNEDMKFAVKSAHRQNPKPNHAAEGAIAVSAVLMKGLVEPFVVRAVLTAITRHHTPFATDFQKHMYDSQAAHHIAETVSRIPDTIRRKINLGSLLHGSQPDPSFGTSILVQPPETWAWLAYTLLVRALRRADPIGSSYRQL